MFRPLFAVMLLAASLCACTTAFKGPLGGTFKLGYEPPGWIQVVPPEEPVAQAPAPAPAPEPKKAAPANPEAPTTAAPVTH